MVAGVEQNADRQLRIALLKCAESAAAGLFPQLEKCAVRSCRLVTSR
jgi:hypothetical protein